MTRNRFGGLFLKKCGMHTVAAALALMSCFLPPADGAFTRVTPICDRYHVALPRSLRKNILIPSCVELKSKSDGIEHSAQEQSYHLNRRQVLQTTSYLGLSQPLIHATNARAIAEQEALPIRRGEVFEIEDPNSYSAVAYIPPTTKRNGESVPSSKPYPLLVVLHGAGNNRNSALDEFTRAGGDHASLPPYLLSTGQAPRSLSENFVVVAPFAGRGRRSLYDEPRSKILSFVKWFNAWIESQPVSGGEGDGTAATNDRVAIDRRRVSLLGFSEGSTLAVELATTRQFNGVVVCAYGFTGTLPKMAVERLQGIPMWVFHSRGDDVYDVQCSNALVESLIAYEGGLDVFGVGNIVKYTKLIPQKSSNSAEDFEHVRAALVASKDGEVYSWLLSL